MLGSKKGIRDIRRGLSDMSNGIAEARIATTRDPARALELMESQRDKEREQALKHQAKAKGIFNGPAELRAAKACEARAETWQRRIDEHLKKHDDLTGVVASGPSGSPVASRLQDLEGLLSQGLISSEEYRERRSKILGEL